MALGQPLHICVCKICECCKGNVVHCSAFQFQVCNLLGFEVQLFLSVLWSVRCEYIVNCMLFISFLNPVYFYAVRMSD